MTRSTWKNNLAQTSLRQKFSNQTIKIWKKNESIPMFLTGKSVLVYNGKSFKKISITRNRVGYKFGEFTTTRKFNKKLKKITKKK
jgi:small subunit ribosomal protein S19